MSREERRMSTDGTGKALSRSAVAPVPRMPWMRPTAIAAPSLLLALLLLGGLAACNPMAIPKVRGDTWPTYTREQLLTRGCEGGQPADCRALAEGYEAGNLGEGSLNYVPKNPQLALKARLAACALRFGGDCYLASFYYRNGLDVARDLGEAARLLRLACNVYLENNAHQAASCSALGETLMAFDPSRHYDEAILALDQGCALQREQCRVKESFTGTGRPPAGKEPPDGALGFGFRTGATVMSEICAQLGGTATLDGIRGLRCEGPRLGALRNHAVTLALDFCDRDSLCSITATLPDSPFKALDEYTFLMGGLVGLYGVASSSVLRANPECTGEEGKLLRCLREGTARAQAIWAWGARGRIQLSVVEKDGGAVAVLSYQSERGMHTFGNPGL